MTTAPINIYGHTLNLWQPDDGGLITDVVVLARVVRYDDDGDAADALLMSATRSTGKIVQAGILSAAMDAAGAWGREDDE